MTSLLHEQRIETVLAALLESGAETILDLGCGDGVLPTRLATQPSIRRIVGMDVSAEALTRLRQRLENAPAAMRRPRLWRHVPGLGLQRRGAGLRQLGQRRAHARVAAVGWLAEDEGEVRRLAAAQAAVSHDHPDAIAARRPLPTLRAGVRQKAPQNVPKTAKLRHSQETDAGI